MESIQAHIVQAIADLDKIILAYQAEREKLQAVKDALPKINQ